MSQTIQLSRAIEAHGATLSEITLREPTTADVIDIGQPYVVLMVGDESALEIRAKVIARYISVLAGIPPSSVKDLTLSDFSRCQGVVMGFFGQADEQK